MRTLVIGEVGNNFQNKKDCLDSIDFLRSRGCLIKFQAHGGMFEHLKDYALPKEWMVEWKADDIFYSVFNTDMVDWLEENVRPGYYKIASRSYFDEGLQDRIIHTGATVIKSVPLNIPTSSFSRRGSGVLYLHCVNSYPAPNAHLGRLNEFDGYSDHTTSTLVPAIAVAKGAKIIEKHFAIREMDTPDRPHSLLPNQWDEMISNIKEAEYHLGL